MYSKLWYVISNISVYQDVSVFEIILPVRPNVSLTSNVPHVKLETRRLNTFDIETLKFAQLCVRGRVKVIKYILSPKQNLLVLEWFVKYLPKPFVLIASFFQHYQDLIKEFAVLCPEQPEVFEVVTAIPLKQSTKPSIYLY